MELISKRHPSYARANEPQLVAAKAADVSLVLFDVDGTLIDDYASKGGVWSRIHALAGVTEEIRAQREAKHRAGLLSYDEWMSLDIGDWKTAGLTKTQILETLGSLSLSLGAKETLETLHCWGYRLGIVSSSIDVGIFSLVDQTLFDELAINRLFFDENGRICSWDTSTCKLKEKAAQLKHIAKKWQLPPSHIAYVGNDRNDAGAASFAGLSFAFNCRDLELLEVATWIDRTGDMRSILPFFDRQHGTR